jgi:hypothetical protein
MLLPLNSGTAFSQGTGFQIQNVPKDQAPAAFAKNSVYVEFLGPGILYSLNYDRLLTQHISIRAGVSAWSIDSLDLIFLQITDFKYRSFPVMINYLTGKKASHLELGIGIMPVFVEGAFQVFYFLGSSTQDKTSALLGIGTIGYRYQHPAGGLVVRAAATPIFNTSGATLSFGFSVGFGF